MPKFSDCVQTATSSQADGTTALQLVEFFDSTVPVKGSFELINSEVRDFLTRYVQLCKPENVHICDGSDQENEDMCSLMKTKGMIRRVTHKGFSNW